MIKTSNLKVIYPKRTIVFDDFQINKSKITFITGKNGTGKTTFLKSIANLIPYQGDIQTDGYITYSSQEPVIFQMTVYDNIIYPLKIRKKNIEEYKDKILEYCSLLEINTLLNDDASKLSSGEKMKVAILRSIIFTPDYVLLDEPTTHLDVDSIDNLIKLIKSLKSKITFIIVSHNKQFIDQLKEEELKLGDRYV